MSVKKAEAWEHVSTCLCSIRYWQKWHSTVKVMWGRCLSVIGTIKSCCFVCRGRKMCLLDRLYLSSTVPMSIPLLCPHYPGRQRSSDTPLYVASSDSQMSVKETERLASALMETIRYTQCAWILVFMLLKCLNFSFTSVFLFLSGGTEAFSEWSRAYGRWRWLQPHQCCSIWTCWRLPDFT